MATTPDSRRGPRDPTQRDLGGATHLDGARPWEAQPCYDRPSAEVAALFDTVYVSLHKGLEGVRGAVLAGDRAGIDAASVWRHRPGVATPDSWPAAVTALMGLDEVLPRMAEFRDHAAAVAAATRILAENGVRLPQRPRASPDPVRHRADHRRRVARLHPARGGGADPATALSPARGRRRLRRRTPRTSPQTSPTSLPTRLPCSRSSCACRISSSR